ncbi:MAG: Tfp pilus assembly protein FimT/FimU [bacterium]
MGTRGITLIELLVAIAVLSILVLTLGFSFQGWIGKYDTERTIKELYSDLMTARARAMQKNRMHYVLFPDTSSFSLYEDTSDGANKVNDGDGRLQTGTGPGADSELPTFPKSLHDPFALTWNLAFGGDRITFDQRGQLYPNGTLCMFTDFDEDEMSDYDPDYDCIVLSQTRITLGKLRKQNTGGGHCNADNCEKL